MNLIIAETLKSKLNELPKKPGVYIFRNSAGKIIYIGKALVLKNRVGSYFKQKHTDPKTIELVTNIADWEFIVVNSEFEALLLEAHLIKQHAPKYNIVQKDSKSYLYIVIGKEYPNRIFTARWTELSELSENILDWYGPFPSSTDARQILKFVRRIFPFRSCKKLPKSPCLYKDLKLCPGVCILSDSTYSKTIRNIKLVLSGKIINLVSLLTKEMKEFSKNFNYEEAQMVKRQIEALQSLTSGWRTVPKEKQDFAKIIFTLRKLIVKYQGFDPTFINKIEGYDVSNLGKTVIVGSMVAFVNGEPEKDSYRKFNMEYNLAGPDDPEGIKKLIERRFKHSEWVFPQVILVDGGKTQIGAAFEAIKNAGQVGKISLLGLTKEFETIIIPKIKQEKIVGWQTIRLARRSPELQLLQAIRDEAHRFAQKYYQKLHQKFLLK